MEIMSVEEVVKRFLNGENFTNYGVKVENGAVYVRNNWEKCYVEVARNVNGKIEFPETDSDLYDDTRVFDYCMRIKRYFQ